MQLSASACLIYILFLACKKKATEKQAPEGKEEFMISLLII